MIKKVFSAVVVMLLIATSSMAFETGPTVGKMAPDFELKDMSGKNVKLSEVLKTDDVLLVFWTTWCPWCVKEIEPLIEVHNKYDKKGLKIIAVNITVNDSITKVEKMVDKYKVPYMTLLDAEGAVANNYNVSGIPLNLVIGRDGLIKYRDNRMLEDVSKFMSKAATPQVGKVKIINIK